MTTDSSTPVLRRRLPVLALAAGVLPGLTGCATFRAPAGQIADPVPVHDGRAEPQAALWIESGSRVTPEEGKQAVDQARTALTQSLDGRAALPGDPLVVVRAQGVVRTDSHKRDQHAAVVGAVVGTAVVVTAIIITATADHGHGHKLSSSGAARAPAPKGSAIAPRPGVRAPPVGARGVAVPGGVARGGVPAPRLAPGGRTAVPRPVPAPAQPWRGGYPRAPAPGPYYAPVYEPAWDVSFGFGWGWGWGWYEPGYAEGVAVYPAPPYPPPPAAYPPPYAYAPAPGAPPPAPGHGDAGAPPAEAAPDEEAQAQGEAATPAPLTAVSLAPLAPLPVEKRGFFDGDFLLLDVTLVDRATGEPLWWKQLTKEIDVRDPKAVRAMMDEALVDEAWQPAPAPPAQPLQPPTEPPPAPPPAPPAQPPPAPGA